MAALAATSDDDENFSDGLPPSTEVKETSKPCICQGRASGRDGGRAETVDEVVSRMIRPRKRRKY